jgi:hypothetical protein
MDTGGNPRQHAGGPAMRVKEFWQWLIDLADATDNAPIDLPSAEHYFLTGRTVADYLRDYPND